MTEPRQYVTVEEMTTPGQTDEDDVQLESGRWVRVRGLTRAEAAKLQDIKGTLAGERFSLACGFVIPRMNEPQVEAMMNATPAGELNPASIRILELSGLAEGAEKEAVRDFETGKVSEFRVLPSDQVGDDGSAATPDDGQ